MMWQDKNELAKEEMSWQGEDVAEKERPRRNVRKPRLIIVLGKQLVVVVGS